MKRYHKAEVSLKSGQEMSAQKIPAHVTPPYGAFFLTKEYPGSRNWQAHRHCAQNAVSSATSYWTDPARHP